MPSKTKGVRWFRKYFLGNDYSLYVGLHSFLGVLVAVYLRDPSGNYRTIYMNQMGFECRAFDNSLLSQGGGGRLALFQGQKKDGGKKPPIMAKINPALISKECQLLSVKPDRMIDEKLTIFASLHSSEMSRANFVKVGLMYFDETTSSQAALFGHQQGSPAYDQFLAWLGDKVAVTESELNTSHPTHYQGGLVPADASHLLWTKYGDKQIAFHVCQWIASDWSDNEQRVLHRKKFISNDSVVVVFNDSDSCSFDPGLIVTHYTQIYVVVQPQHRKVAADDQHYRMAVCSRGVLPWLPSLPRFTWYQADQSFLYLLLAKIVGGQNSCYNSPVFSKRFVRSRTLLLEELWEIVSTRALTPSSSSTAL